MSLTTALQAKNYPDLRTKLKTAFPRPKIKLEAELLAPPRTQNYAIVGAAFDYALRYLLADVATNSTTINLITRPTVANQGKEALDRKYGSPPKPPKIEDAHPDLPPSFAEARLRAKSLLYEQALKTYENYQRAIPQIDRAVEQMANPDVNSTAFLRACITYAKLDAYARSQRVASDFNQVNTNDTADLQALIEAIPSRLSTPHSQVILNPIIGPKPLSGDGDLIVDNTLIDIKTTKHLKLERTVLNQLICYYTGYLQSDEYQPKQVTHLGIYFARHGYLWTIPTAQLGRDEDFLNFGTWFSNYFTNYDVTKPANQQQTDFTNSLPAE